MYIHIEREREIELYIYIYIYIYIHAKVMIFGRLGTKGTPRHFWEDKSRLTGEPSARARTRQSRLCSNVAKII